MTFVETIYTVEDFALSIPHRSFLFKASVAFAVGVFLGLAYAVLR